jgi:hypothetical protein
MFVTLRLPIILSFQETQQLPLSFTYTPFASAPQSQSQPALSVDFGFAVWNVCHATPSQQPDRQASPLLPFR